MIRINALFTHFNKKIVNKLSILYNIIKYIINKISLIQKKISNTIRII